MSRSPNALVDFYVPIKAKWLRLLKHLKAYPGCNYRQYMTYVLLLACSHRKHSHFDFTDRREVTQRRCDTDSMTGLTSYWLII